MQNPVDPLPPPDDAIYLSAPAPSDRTEAGHYLLWGTFTKYSVAKQDFKFKARDFGRFAFKKLGVIRVSKSGMS